jgi:ribonucleoside-diphosphate reductase alpha chain
MRVKKRNGVITEVQFDEIKRRLLALCDQQQLQELDVDEVVIRTINGMVDCITTSELDKLAANHCASLQSRHYRYSDLAGKLLLSNLHKTLTARMQLPQRPTFSQRMTFFAQHKPTYFQPDFLHFVVAHAAHLDEMVDYDACPDTFTYFSFKTLEKSYLLRLDDGTLVESPHDMFMRVAVAIHQGHLDKIRDTYDAMVTGKMIHATPTLFNAGSRFQQMSSCYLMGTRDSLTDIYKTLGDAAQISKWAGGIGLHVSGIRAKGSPIVSTNGTADGLVPLLRLFNETARYCNQAGKRKGSICIYLEPWHADVFDFVELRRNTGAETERARDLFLALWVPDLFMQRVSDDGPWWLMSPDQCPGLNDCWGPDFERLYLSYVAQGRFRRQVRARDLWSHILQCQMETGTPYIAFKDHVNRKSNHANVGIIRSSNLCAEITIHSDHASYGVCNLASIAVNSFLTPPHHDDHDHDHDHDDHDHDHDHDPAAAAIDHPELHRIAQMLTENLNNVIDLNFYPTPETERNNRALRPIGIGIQGFADLLCRMRVPFDSPRAMDIGQELMETIYHGALTKTVQLAQLHGAYAHFGGSPFHAGKLQFDLWGHRPVSRRYDWDALRARVAAVGTRNSLLTALMPTASTSQILGNQECFEPYTSNIYKRTTMAGEFLVINRHLMQDLMRLNLWTEHVRNDIIRHDGSVQHTPDIPADIKALYKTVWEIPQRCIIDHAVARAPFVDQSQSMNLFFDRPDFLRLSSALFHAWVKGLKTGCYYLRSKPAREALKVSVLRPSASVCAKDSSAEACLLCGA